MRAIGYNSQRDNISFGGKFKAFWQCFSTSSWMFMSYYSPRYMVGDDRTLAEYLDDVELSIGKRGIAEKTIARLGLKITKNSSLYWVIQQSGIDLWLAMAGIRGKAIFHDASFPIYSLPTLLKSGPVIIGTKKMGGLPGGHIILLVDYDPQSNDFIVNDPFGNARTNYASQSGQLIRYNAEWLRKYIEFAPWMCRCIYWEEG